MNARPPAGNGAPPAKRRVRPTLLILLWAWALVVFVAIDLFLNVPEFDRVRPDARIYQGMRMAAHDMVGEPYEGDGAAAAEAVTAWAPESDRMTASAYLGRKSAPPGTRPAHTLRTYRRTKFRNHGTWTEWNLPGLQPGEGELNEKGRKQGTWVWKWEDGSPREERHYADGVLDGAVTAWYADGRKQTAEEYEKGKRVGVWRYWHPNGQLAAQETYRAGQPHGLWQMWYADGTKAMQGEYREGSPVETWSFWDERGAVIKEEVHN